MATVERYVEKLTEYCDRTGRKYVIIVEKKGEIGDYVYRVRSTIGIIKKIILEILVDLQKIEQKD